VYENVFHNVEFVDHLAVFEAHHFLFTLYFTDNIKSFLSSYSLRTIVCVYKVQVDI